LTATTALSVMNSLRLVPLVVLTTL